MKLKNYWKRFWTLDRHHAAGFTLVELIVVIAILAVLAGVGIPVYSGYITKANQQADLTLISEIEQALTLAYYNQELPDGAGGYVLLRPEGIEVDEELLADEIAASAIEKVFGSNWMDFTLLKYDSWGVKNMVLSYDDATAFVGSNFNQEYTPEELMSEVQAMTSAVNAISDLTAFADVKAMYNYGDNKNVIDDVIEEYGITKSWDQLGATEKSNLLVLASATSINGEVGTRAEGPLSVFAVLTAYAAVDEDFNAEYRAFQNTISNLDPDNESQYNQIKAAYNTLKAKAEGDSDYLTWRDANRDSHIQAFNAAMAGVGNAMKDNGDAILAELGNPDMFTTGIGSKLYADFLETAEVTAGSDVTEEFISVLQAGDIPGGVLVSYAVVNGVFYIDNSLPTT